MVESIKSKKIIFPLIFGLLFSILYNILPFKYFSLSIVGFLGVILVLYDIRLGLMAGVFILPFMPDMLNLLYMYFLLAVFFYNQVIKEENPISKSNLDMPIILFLIIIIISTITSINPVGSLRDLAIHIAGLSFLFVMANSIKTKEDFNTIITVLVFSATLVSLYGLFQYVVGVDIEAAWVDKQNSPDITTRVYSVFANPNILAEYLVMIIPLSVSLLWYSKKLHKKILFLGTSLIMILALVLTFSRGGWLGFAFSALVFILLVERKFLLSLIPITIGGVYFLPDSILNRILSIANFADSSNAIRIEMWQITIQMIKDNWMAGVGFGHLPFRQSFGTYIRTISTYHAHNTYLQTAAELGIPGLLVLLFMIFILFKYGIKKLIVNDDKYIKIMAAGALSSIGGVFAHGVAENLFYLPRIIITFWILVSFVLTLVRIHENEDHTLGKKGN